MIVAVPDTHFPYVDVKAMDAMLRDIAELQPDYVVQMGDAYDLYNFSTHATSRLGQGPMEELTEGRAAFEAFWRAVKHAAPKAACHQIMGNHDLRIRKKIVKHLPEMEAVLDVLDLESLWRFPGVELHASYREPLELEGIVFHHGFGKFGTHMRKFLKPTVCGHLHLGAVEYMSLWGHTVWELNAGFLGQKDDLVFAYTPTKLANWTTGYGLIDDKGPRFVAL